MWWWLSFCDPDRPDGEQWIGCSFVKAASFFEAVAAAHAAGCNPGGECFGADVPPELGDPPAGSAWRTISSMKELDAISHEWTGSGVARVDEVEAARLS